MADPTEDELKVLPFSRLPSDVLTEAPPAAPDAVSGAESSSTSGAAPTPVDAKVAGVTPAADAPKPSTPVVSDLAKAAAIKSAVDSGDPAAVAAATGKAPDLAKLAEIQKLVSPASAAAPVGAAPPMPAPAVTAPSFAPIPSLVADVQAAPAPGAVPPGAVGPALPLPPGAPPAAQGAPPPIAPAPDAVTGGAPAVIPPPPDAISGATPAFPGTGPSVANTPGLTFSMDGQGPGAGPLPPTDEYGNPLGVTAGMTDEQAKQWAQTAPAADILEQRRLLELRQRNTALARGAEVDAANLRQLKQNQSDMAASYAAAQAKSDRIVADAIKLATTKTDPDRYLSTRTASQRLRDILLAAAGGLLQARQGPGARNIGIDMVQREIDHDIDAQKQDIENGKTALSVRQNAVAEEFKRSGNLYESAEKVRLATYEAATRRLEAEQQNFDPRGTSYLNYAAAINDMRGKAAEHVEKIRQQSFDEDLKTRKEKREQETAQANIQHQRNEDAIAFGKFGLERDKQKNENQVWTPQQLAAINPGLPVPPIAMTQKEFGAWVGNQKTGGEIQQQARQEQDRQADRVRQYSIGDVTPRLATDESGKLVTGPDGQPLVQHGPLVNADGKPFLASGEGAHKTLSAKYLAASEITDIINEAQAIRDRVGGESGTANSDDYQRLKVLESRLSVLAKSGTEGMSSDEDMRRLTSTLGADNLTSFRARAAGLKEALQHTETELNKALRIANYTGPTIKFANPYSAPPSKASAQDLADQDLLKKPAGYDQDAAFKRDVLEEYKRRTIGMSPEERKAFESEPLTEDRLAKAALSYKPDQTGNVPGVDINEPDPKRVKANIELSLGQRDIINEVASKFDPGATIGQQRRIDELGQAALGSDVAAENARKLLAKVASDGHTQRLRALAKEALDAAARASIPETSIEPGIATSSAAYETLPPPAGRGR